MLCSLVKLLLLLLEGMQIVIVQRIFLHNIFLQKLEATETQPTLSRFSFSSTTSLQMFGVLTIKLNMIKNGSIS